MLVPRWVGLASWAVALVVAQPGATRADSPPNNPKVPWVDLLNAGRAGEIGVEAEAAANGQMAVRVSNPTNRQLRVVLPPGLIASNATGQFAAIGGLGNLGFNALGGIGGFGNTIGFGNFGGFGNFAFGGNQFGMPAGFRAFGPAPVQQTVLPQVGLSWLGQAIFQSTGHPDSWDKTTIVRGLNPGMGAFGVAPQAAINPLAGPGNPFAGLGFRSVPPTDLPELVLEPGETRAMLTRLVSLRGPNGPTVTLPRAGERLQLAGPADANVSPRVRDVLRRLARAKAPESVAQTALWGASGLSWEAVAQASRNWAGDYDIALARSLVERVQADPAGVRNNDADRLWVEAIPHDPALSSLAEEITGALGGRSMLGLTVAANPPASPDGPAIACRVRVNGTDENPEVIVEIQETDATGRAWTNAGKFPVKLARDPSGRVDPNALGDAVSDGLLRQFVIVSLKTTREAKGRTKATYAVQVENRSVLILNGITLDGPEATPASQRRDAGAVKTLAGIGVAPHHAFQLPATADAVERRGLKRGIRVAAVDLSAL